MRCYCKGGVWRNVYWGPVRGLKDNGNVFECMNCGVQRLAEALPSAIYHTNAYRELIGEHAWEDHTHYLPQKQNLALIDVPLFGKKVLDVGAGGGTLAKMISGMCDVKTVEPNVDYSADYRSVADAKGKFDIICAFDVLEHVDDPSLFLSECAGLLAEGGVMYVTTPNRSCFLMDLPEYVSFFYRAVHRWYWHPVSLERLMWTAGLIGGIRSFHRYGLANAFGWYQHKKPMGNDYRKHTITDAIDAQWKSYLESLEIGDNLLLRVTAQTSRR